ncbi:ankyrin repeat-containing domain protein [Aspergillus nidulans var. acristatus]
MSLISLPAEILQQVGKYVTPLSTLNALSRANRRLNSIFDPLLYRQDARRAHSLPVSAGGAAAVRWAAKHGLMRTLQKSLEAGSEVPPRAPRMSVVHEPTGRTVYGVTVDWRFQDPVPPPHPLCLAVQGGHAEIVEFFLDEKGCDVDMCDQHGLSLLEQAVVHGHVQIVEGLLRRGASQLGGPRWVGAPLVIGCPIQLAVSVGRMDIMHLLWEYGSFLLWLRGWELGVALECAIATRNMDAIRTLISYGVSVHRGFTQRNSITPLEWAVEMGDVELVELFLSAGARPRYPRSATGCALVRAVKRRDKRIASLLVGDSSCMQKTMALAFAAEQEDGHFARFLLQRGTHPDFDELEYAEVHPAEGFRGSYYFASPLTRAVNAGHAHLVRLLVEHGADVNVPFEGFVGNQSSREKGSVLRLAMDLESQDIVSFLREHGAQEDVVDYTTRVSRLSLEEATVWSSGRQKRRTRLRRHMGINRCNSFIPSS